VLYTVVFDVKLTKYKHLVFTTSYNVSNYNLLTLTFQTVNIQFLAGQEHFIAITICSI